MNGLPYYKAYPRDFIDGTVGMPFELKAAYRLVLDLIYLQGGELPDDARYISGLLGCSVRFWNKARQQLLEAGKIHVQNGVISNFRADKELKTTRTLQEKNRKNGAKSNKNRDLEKANAQLTRGIDTKTNINKPPISPLQGDTAAPPKKSRSKKNQIDRPEDVPEQLWSDFLVLRKQHRAPFTQTAFEGFQREAAAANITLSQAITIAIERGWRGFKAEWVKPEDIRAAAAEQPVPEEAPVEIGGRKIKRAGVVEALRRYFESGQWSTHTFSVLGPAPGQENCLIPDDVIQEARGGNLIQFPGVAA